MHRLYLKIADLVLCVHYRYRYVPMLCAPYVVEACPADATVSVTDEEILAEQTDRFPLCYLESLAIYRKIAAMMPGYDAFLLHGAVFHVDGIGVAFLAHSGTGKTTHMVLWKLLLQKRMDVINGDKPLIRIKDGIPMAYGTPWAGKENLQKNNAAPLTKICFIERADQNFVTRPTKEDALTRLLGQVFFPDNAEGRAKTLALLDRVMAMCDFYIIHCNMEQEAAQVAYREVMAT